MDLTQYYPLFAGTPLLQGFSPAELDRLLPALDPMPRQYRKGEVLLRYGEASSRLGIVLSGCAEAYRPLPAGGRSLLHQLSAGGIYGDVLGASAVRSPVSVEAAADCRVLTLSCPRMLASDGSELRTRLLQNLTGTMGRKYFALFDRIELLTMKTLRGKIAAYLLSLPAENRVVTLPFSRAALADYLCCERSALSRELSRMQADGLLKADRSRITLLDTNALEDVQL